MTSASDSVSPQSTPPHTAISAPGCSRASSAAVSSRWASTGRGCPSRVPLPSTTMACTAGTCGGSSPRLNKRLQNHSTLSTHRASNTQAARHTRWRQGRAWRQTCTAGHCQASTSAPAPSTAGTCTPTLKWPRAISTSASSSSTAPTTASSPRATCAPREEEGCACKAIAVCAGWISVEGEFGINGQRRKNPHSLSHAGPAFQPRYAGASRHVGAAHRGPYPRITRIRGSRRPRPGNRPCRR